MKSWTPTEIEILNTFTGKVRAMELSQIGDVWWPGQASKRGLQRELEKLCYARLLLRAVLIAHRRLAIESPLIAWSPNDPEPDFHSTRSAILARWRCDESPVAVYWASSKAANVFGSTGSLPPRAWHLDHDLLLSEVYVHYQKNFPNLISDWIGENSLPKAGYRIKDPDAFLLDNDGEPYRVIESAGRYSIKQLQSFHDHCAERCIPYELW
jgi:hypothetical protein